MPHTAADDPRKRARDDADRVLLLDEAVAVLLDPSRAFVQLTHSELAARTGFARARIKALVGPASELPALVAAHIINPDRAVVAGNAEDLFSRAADDLSNRGSKATPLETAVKAIARKVVLATMNDPTFRSVLAMSVYARDLDYVRTAMMRVYTKVDELSRSVIDAFVGANGPVVEMQGGFLKRNEFVVLATTMMEGASLRYPIDSRLEIETIAKGMVALFAASLCLNRTEHLAVSDFLATIDQACQAAWPGETSRPEGPAEQG